MQSGDIESVFPPKLHYFVPDQRNVQVAGPTAAGVKRFTVLPPLVSNYTASERRSCAFGQSCLQLYAKLSIPQRVSIKCQPYNSLLHLLVSHGLHLYVQLACDLLSALLYTAFISSQSSDGVFMNIELRPATMADIPALEELIRASVTSLSAEH